MCKISAAQDPKTSPYTATFFSVSTDNDPPVSEKSKSRPFPTEAVNQSDDMSNIIASSGPDPSSGKWPSLHSNITPKNLMISCGKLFQSNSGHCRHDGVGYFSAHDSPDFKSIHFNETRGRPSRQRTAASSSNGKTCAMCTTDDQSTVDLL